MYIAGCADEENQTAAGGPRAKERSKDSASSDGCAQKLSFEKFCDQICDCHWAPAKQAIHVLPAQVANGASSLKHAPQVAAVGIVNAWRRQDQCLRDDAAHLSERFLKLGILGCIFRRELCDLFRGFLGVVIEM